MLGFKVWQRFKRWGLSMICVQNTDAKGDSHSIEKYDIDWYVFLQEKSLFFPVFLALGILIYLKLDVILGKVYEPTWRQIFMLLPGVYVMYIYLAYMAKKRYEYVFRIFSFAIVSMFLGAIAFKFRTEYVQYKNISIQQKLPTDPTLMKDSVKPSPLYTPNEYVNEGLQVTSKAIYVKGNIEQIRLREYRSEDAKVDAESKGTVRAPESNNTNEEEDDYVEGRFQILLTNLQHIPDAFVLDNCEGNLDFLYQDALAKNILNFTNKLPKKVLLHADTEFADQLQAGQVILAKVRLMPVSMNIVPDGPDPRFYAYFDNIGSAGKIVEKPRIIASFKLGIREQVRRFIMNALDDKALDLNALALSGKQELKTESKQMYAHTKADTNADIPLALLLGDKSLLNKQLLDDFNKTGLGHVLSVSGLHMSIIAAFGFLLGKFLVLCLSLISFRALRFSNIKFSNINLHYLTDWCAKLKLLKLFKNKSQSNITNSMINSQNAITDNINPKKFIPNQGLLERMLLVAKIVSLGSVLAFLSLSGASFATMRASIMFIIGLLLFYTQRYTLLPYVLSATVSLILLIYPESLFYASFQFSAMAMVGICLIYNRKTLRGDSSIVTIKDNQGITHNEINNINRSNKMHAHSFQTHYTKSSAGKILHIWEYIKTGLYSTFLISAITFPFMMYYFEQTSIQPFVANLICLPYITVILLPSLLLWLIVWLFVDWIIVSFVGKMVGTLIETLIGTVGMGLICIVKIVYQYFLQYILFWVFYIPGVETVLCYTWLVLEKCVSYVYYFFQTTFQMLYKIFYQMLYQIPYQTLYQMSNQLICYQVKGLKWIIHHLADYAWMIELPDISSWSLCVYGLCVWFLASRLQALNKLGLLLGVSVILYDVYFPAPKPSLLIDQYGNMAFVKNVDLGNNVRKKVMFVSWNVSEPASYMLDSSMLDSSMIASSMVDYYMVDKVVATQKRKEKFMQKVWRKYWNADAVVRFNDVALNSSLEMHGLDINSMHINEEFLMENGIVHLSNNRKTSNVIFELDGQIFLWWKTKKSFQEFYHALMSEPNRLEQNRTYFKRAELIRKMLEKNIFCVFAGANNLNGFNVNGFDLYGLEKNGFNACTLAESSDNDDNPESGQSLHNNVSVPRLKVKNVINPWELFSGGGLMFVKPEGKAKAQFRHYQKVHDRLWYKAGNVCSIV